MSEKIRVMLVDDEALLIESLEIILSLNAGMEIVGKAKEGEQALEILKSTQADIALVDLNMEGMGGIELILNIKSLYPLTKILVLTTFYDEKNITCAIANGADGYLLKDSGRAAIINAIENVINGQSVIDSKVMQTLSRLMHSPRSGQNISQQAFSELTKREGEICRMLAEGYTNSQMAKLLYISEGTVKNYISSIYDKTGIRDRAQLALALKEML